MTCFSHFARMEHLLTRSPERWGAGRRGVGRQKGKHEQQMIVTEEISVVLPYTFKALLLPAFFIDH